MIAKRAAWVVALAVWPAWAATDPGSPPPPGPAVEVHPDGALSLRVEEPVPLADLVRTIGERLDAKVVVYSDVGHVGPVAIEGLTPAEALVHLTEPHSLALRYEDGRIVAIVLMASKGAARGARRIVHRAPAAAPHPPLTAGEVENQRATTVRDIVKLSYQKDEAAAGELERLFLGSDDPAVRGAAIAALATNDTLAAARLIDRALSDNEPGVRLHAATSYLIARGIEAAPRLRAMSRTDPAPEVREGVARLLTEGQAMPSRGDAGPHPQVLSR